LGTQPDEMTTGGDALNARRGPATGDDRAEGIEAEIVETREDLADTVRQIGARLEPANLAAEARETVTGAARGKVEQMSMGAQETWRDVRTGNAGSILDMVRENPIPAAMVGIGVGMLLMNRGAKPQGDGPGLGRWQGDARGDRGGSYGSGPQGARYGSRDWRAEDGDGRMAQMGDMAANARDALGDAAGSFGDRVGGVADSVGDMAGALPEQAGEMWDMRLSQAQRFMEQNPLGAGLVAMAAGAAIGMLIPTSSFERENVGPVRDQLVDKAASAAEDAIEGATTSTSSAATGGKASTSKT
jgi:hypothetical protein